jgi:type I restriction enzyme R subunit
MLNFDYLKEIPELSQLHEYCDMAERRQLIEPETSALAARRALEWLTKAIYTMKNVVIGERVNLFELTNAETFRDFIADSELMKAIHFIRKVGNAAAHDGTVTKRDSFFSLIDLYNVVGAVLLKLRVLSTLAPFDKSLIPGREQPLPPARDVAVSDATTKAFAATVEPEVVAEAPEVAPVLAWDDINEAETRRLLIDLMLREAGWEVVTTDGVKYPGKACVEIEVQDMPNNQGVGYADYVLFGPNGKPLAVIEAKRTSVSPSVGEQQATLYADCLEREYGVRPVIYFTNGYETWIVDGLGYPKRQLYAFHTLDDLMLLHQRRGRKDITDMSVKDSISDRGYQKQSIKRICEHLNKKFRRGLLVMATGTGKTRTAISLVDVLQRAGWVKNTLFLADRTSLVKQAHRNFVKLLPDASTTVLSDKDTTPDLNARIIFSTYQTMINHIDSDTKTFSVGRFDLIIIDEAHRSVFGKYGAIFNYFDSFLIGLTATPRDQVDKSTYDLLQLEDGEPNFAYNMEEAVNDGYLVPYVGKKRDSAVVNDGIKYNQLSQQEKDQLEKVWEYEQATSDPNQPIEPRDIQSREIYKYIFNRDTIDKVLQDLMENGLKVNSGEKIGKTIIFAFNTPHAELIVKRFNALYPELGNDFCRQIDYSIKYYQSLIDKFEQRDSLPQIAVSVDMLDTGIDVPDILNLVIFKRVRSRIKFMQMLGRGTRLCPNIFGAGKDKKEFYVFDWCGNFNYFEMNPKDTKLPPMQSLTERIFGVRADIAYCLQTPEHQNDEYAKAFHDELKALLREQIVQLPDSHISVRAHWAAVTRYRTPEAWVYLKATDVVELKNEVAPLILKNGEDEKAKKFDLLALYVQLSLLDDTFAAAQYEAKITFVIDALRQRASIPAIKKQLPHLNEFMTSEFWNNKTLASIENMRKVVRELMQYLTGDAGKTFEVDIDDTITIGQDTKPISMSITYRQKVFDFLNQNRDLPVLNKIKNIEQLSSDDIKELERIMWQELGTKQDYLNFLARENLAESCGDSVAAFLRTIIKVDRQKAIELFTKYISENTLNADQEEYLKSILDYVCENGDMKINTLVNEAPFDEINVIELFPGKAQQIAAFIATLHKSITAA